MPRTIKLKKRTSRPELEVVHAKDVKKRRPGDVYIGRDFGEWKDEGFGNPYSIRKVGSRRASLRKFRDYLNKHPEIIDQLRARKPKRLICWCKPLECHGDIYMEELNK